jgi:hypothetical protein
MSFRNTIIIIFFVIVFLSIIALAKGEKYPADPWFFPLIAALILQLWQSKNY